MRVVARVGRCVTVAAFLAAAATVLTLAALQMQGKQLLTVMSGSMTPAFVAGDVVVIEHVDQQDLKPGMIVSFHPPGSPEHLTTHRILSMQPKPYGLFIQTKGDANATPDPDFAAAGNVAGVVTSTVPLVGRWLVFYQSPHGRLLVLGTPMLLLIIGQTIESLRDLKQARRRGTRPVGRGGATGRQTPAAPSRSTRPTVPAFSTVTTSVLAIGIVVAAASGGVVLGHRTNAAFVAKATSTGSTLSTGTWCTTAAYASAVNADSPDIYYRLDETSGSTAVDSSANARNGVYQGSRTPGVTGAVCAAGKAVTYAAGGYISNTQAYSISTNSGIEAWIKVPSGGGGVIASMSTTNGAVERILYMTTAGKLAIGGRRNGIQNSVTSPGSYNDESWHHVVGVGSSATLSLYVDGVQVASGTNGQTAVSTGTWEVANDSDGTWTSEPTIRLWKGSLDDVAIYDGTLTAARISTHYAEGH